MSFEQIVIELKKLNRAEKLRAMQVLVMELSAEEQVSLTSETDYELVTPYGNEAAAKVLYDVLKVATATDHLED